MIDGNNPSNRDRFTELMVAQAISGLNPAEQAELERLPGLVEVTPAEVQGESEQLALTAAAADLASFRYEAQPLPTALRDSLLVQAGQYFSTQSKKLVGTDAEAALTQQPFPGADEPPVARRPLAVSPPNWREIVSILAAAACLLLLLSNWDRIFFRPEPAQSVAQLETKFLDSHPEDLIDVAWKPGPDKNGADVRGRVVWSNEMQTGFMTFQDLKANNPLVEQYQLWIFESPDQEHPIDGGVFDVVGGETKIQIDPKIKVDKSVLFAITVEQPGGVVVSSRQRIAALASPD